MVINTSTTTGNFQYNYQPHIFYMWVRPLCTAWTVSNLLHIKAKPLSLANKSMCYLNVRPSFVLGHILNHFPPLLWVFVWHFSCVWCIHYKLITPTLIYSNILNALEPKSPLDGINDILQRPIVFFRRKRVFHIYCSKISSENLPIFKMRFKRPGHFHFYTIAPA